MIRRSVPAALRRGTCLAAALWLGGATLTARAEPPVWAATNFYGVPGLVDMPNARAQPDGEISLSAHRFDNGTLRTALAFQIFPRVQGVFRYATIDRLQGPASNPSRTYDRSFDIRFKLLDEGRYLPDVTVGLQDFGGTGIYSGEYVAATKSFGPFEVTGGIGWGRLGSEGSFENPLGVFGDRFDERPGGFTGRGGEFSANKWFRGPAAVFGGVAWQATDRLRLNAEISSDAYVRETSRGIVDLATPFNFGLDYAATDNLRISAALRGGDSVGIGLTYAINPRRSPRGAGIEPAPEPVLLRPARTTAPELYDAGWTRDARSGPIVEDALAKSLATAGLTLQSYRVTGDTAQVRFVNRTYESQAQALGRAARALTRALPASVETFVLVPLDARSVPASAVVLRRSDVERLENEPDGAAEILAAARIVDAAAVPADDLTRITGIFPKFTWSLGPYVSYTTFDPDSPIRLDLGAQVSARYEPAPGIVFSGALRRKIVGNRSDSVRTSNSVLPRVRTDTLEYLRASEDRVYVNRLTAEWLFRPAEDFYGRISAGLLEEQFGGVSTEVLWRRPESPLAVGLEVNAVRQRDYEMDFGFRDYDVATGHLTGYYDFGGGYVSSLSVGRYLAGDEGATLTLTRRFGNGIEVGAYATKTNVSAEDFGEGSFDKGISVSIPFSFVTGKPSRRSAGLALQPILRDGGARLRVANRLYDLTDDRTGRALTEDWGRFWK